jgi:hypothetical protein
LTTIDVTKNSALEGFDCGYNQLSVLDVSKNPALWYLYCYNNLLTALDVSENKLLQSIYCPDNYLPSPDSVKGWRELGLTINSPTDLFSGTFTYYNQLEPVEKTITVNFPGIKNVSVLYYTNVSGWVTVGKYDDTCKFTIPDGHKATYGDTIIRAQKDGMIYTFSGLKVGDDSLVLNVPVKTIAITGLAAACDLAIVQDNWVYPYAPATVGVANEFVVFDNGKKYEVRLFRTGFYPIAVSGIEAGQAVYFGPSYIYQAEVPAGVTNVWISSYDWAVRGANAGDKIVLIADPANIRYAKMSYAYGGKTYNVEFKLNGSNPFEGLI